AYDDVPAQQTYLTFTSCIFGHARVSDINSACTLTNTVAPDSQYFDVIMQNEVCNGPGNCMFRGITVGPGSIGYASGDIGDTCPRTVGRRAGRETRFALAAAAARQ